MKRKVVFKSLLLFVLGFSVLKCGFLGFGPDLIGNTWRIVRVKDSKGDIIYTPGSENRLSEVRFETNGDPHPVHNLTQNFELYYNGQECTGHFTTEEDSVIDIRMFSCTEGGDGFAGRIFLEEVFDHAFSYNISGKDLEIRSKRNSLEENAIILKHK